MNKNMTFDEVLDLVESLTDEQKESLIEIVRNRLIEERREKLAASIREARKEYQRGEAKQGSVDDLMDDLSK
jgi:hypothetical protein